MQLLRWPWLQAVLGYHDKSAATLLCRYVCVPLLFPCIHVSNCQTVYRLVILATLYTCPQWVMVKGLLSQ